VTDVNDKPIDADFERFLRRRDRLNQDYAALGDEQPSPALDALVLERARAALSEEASDKPWQKRRWPTFMALAATVVLSFAVITRIAVQPESYSTAVTSTAPAEAAPQDAERDIAPAPPMPAPEPSMRSDAPAVANLEQGTQLPRAQIEARIRKENPQFAAPPGAIHQLRAANQEASEQRATDDAELKDVLTTSPAAPAKAKADASDERVASDSDAMAKREGFAQRPLSKEALRESEPKIRELRTQTGALVSPNPPPPRSETVAASPPQAEEVQVTGSRVRTQNSELSAAGMSPVESAPAAAGPSPPETWLTEIRRLKSVGLRKDAEAQLVEFLRAYPGYALPDDVKDLSIPSTQAPASPTK